MRLLFSGQNSHPAEKKNLHRLRYGKYFGGGLFMDKQMHTLKFMQELISIAGFRDKDSIQKENRVIALIDAEQAKDFPDLSVINTLLDCFVGQTCDVWLKERMEEYHKTVAEAWLKVPKTERNKIVENTCKTMIKYGLFSVTKPGFPIMPAAILSANAYQESSEDEVFLEDIKASQLTESNYITGIGQVLAVWIQKPELRQNAEWTIEDIRGMYKECVEKQIPEEL